MRSWDDRWQGENFTRNKAAVEQLTRVAESKDISVTQLALAWLLAQGHGIVPIPGTRSETRLAENVAAADVTLRRTILPAYTRSFPKAPTAAATRPR